MAHDSRVLSIQPVVERQLSSPIVSLPPGEHQSAICTEMVQQSETQSSVSPSADLGSRRRRIRRKKKDLKRPAISQRSKSSEWKGMRVSHVSDAKSGRCSLCKTTFKDFRTHMLTHQSERPEKCPVRACRYNTKGFARKYDRDRHINTHFKGSLDCNFCPHGSSVAQRTFNRVDLFKRHFVNAHVAAQTQSHEEASVSLSPQQLGAERGNSNNCSTCGDPFGSATDFFEHLNDCIHDHILRALRPSQQDEDNMKNLESVHDDPEVQKTLERHGLHLQFEDCRSSVTEDASTTDASKQRLERLCMNVTPYDVGQNIANGALQDAPTTHTAADSKPRCGMTRSEGGVPVLPDLPKKKRTRYPATWACTMDKVRMKKRVLCVYDGTRRLWKDDMMLDSETAHSADSVSSGTNSINLPSADGYVTKLDVYTLRRAEALHGATEEEKGNFISNCSTAEIGQ